jgi:hypothetical protein
MNEIRANGPAPVIEAINVMDLASRAADLFSVQSVYEKQRFLRLVLKSAFWRDGHLSTEFEEPFESLTRSNQLSRTKQAENGMAAAQIQDWLPKTDTDPNTRMENLGGAIFSSLLTDAWFRRQCLFARQPWREGDIYCLYIASKDVQSTLYFRLCQTIFPASRSTRRMFHARESSTKKFSVGVLSPGGLRTSI